MSPGVLLRLQIGSQNARRPHSTRHALLTYCMQAGPHLRGMYIQHGDNEPQHSFLVYCRLLTWSIHAVLGRALVDDMMSTQRAQGMNLRV